MPGNLADIGSFVTGRPVGHGAGWLSLSVDEMTERRQPNAQILRWDGSRLSLVGAVPWHVKALLSTGPSELLAVGEYGDLAAASGGAGLARSRLDAPDARPRDRGPLRSGVVIEGSVFVAGMDRQVYRRNGSAPWSALESGFPAPTRDVAGFEAIDGYSATEVYAAGWRGEIWSFDGARWHRADSPTLSVITCLCCGGDGFVYAAGRSGLLLRGRRDRWQIIDHGADREDFWGLAWFRERLYLSSMVGLSRLEGDALFAVDTRQTGATTFYGVTSTHDQLWSVGPKDVIAFDGTAWTRVG